MAQVQEHAPLRVTAVVNETHHVPDHHRRSGRHDQLDCQPLCRHLR